MIAETSSTTSQEMGLLTIVVISNLSDLMVDPECEEFVEVVLNQNNGNQMLFNHEMLVANFPGPSKALTFSFDLLNAAFNKGFEIGIGIDIKELPTKHPNSLSQDFKEYVKGFLKETRAMNVILTSTVKNMLSNPGLEFTNHSIVFDHLASESIQLFIALDNSHQYFCKTNQITSIDSVVDAAVKCIKQNLSDDLFSVSRLCELIGISERQLQRKLRNTTDMTPNQLIASVRMCRAKELLKSDRFNISEVAYQVGFSSPSYFTRKFKKEFGMSPSLLNEE